MPIDDFHDVTLDAAASYAAITLAYALFDDVTLTLMISALR